MTTGERIQGNPPLIDNDDLGAYSTGLYNEEGYSYCKRRTGRRAGGPSRTIAITICDMDALEPAARWWGLPVRPRGGKATVCPDGPAYRIEASGLRAEMIVGAMMKAGLSLRKQKQWNRVLELCGIKDVSKRLTPGPTRSGECLSLQDSTLARYSTGLFNGGGCSARANGSCRTYPAIEIDMCDHDALEPVGRWWNVQVHNRGDKKKVCVDGSAYRIRTSGRRAIRIVEAMMRYGLSNRKFEQWRKVLSQCQGLAF